MTSTYSHTKYDSDYAALLERVLAADPTPNRRTMRMVREAHGAHLLLDCEGQLPILSLRDIKPMWAFVEASWFMSGSDDPEYMRDFGFHAWDAFADAQGKVSAATGYRWRHAFYVDQLREAVAKLKGDKTSRQSVIVNWDPRRDLVAPGPNAPCILACHFMVQKDLLHMSVFQRSADLYFGLPHDVLGYGIVQSLVASELGLHAGQLSYTVSNAHLYEDQWDAAREMVWRSRNKDAGALREGRMLSLVPEDWYDRAVNRDRTLPKEMHDLLTLWYRPWPALTGPKLAV